MDLIIGVIAVFAGTILSEYLCRKYNLTILVKDKLKIDSRSKTFIINILIFILMVMLFNFTERLKGIGAYILIFIFVFVICFISYINSNIKKVIDQLKKEEIEKNKYKYEMEFCFYCGEEIKNKNEVCPSCGKKLGEGSQK